MKRDWWNNGQRGKKVLGPYRERTWGSSLKGGSFMKCVEGVASCGKGGYTERRTVDCKGIDKGVLESKKN